jgi:hypothetical protein
MVEILNKFCNIRIVPHVGICHNICHESIHIFFGCMQISRGGEGANEPWPTIYF